jgi:hypothetical protein
MLELLGSVIYCISTIFIHQRLREVVKPPHSAAFLSLIEGAGNIANRLAFKRLAHNVFCSPPVVKLYNENTTTVNKMRT